MLNISFLKKRHNIMQNVHKFANTEMYILQHIPQKQN